MHRDIFLVKNLKCLFISLSSLLDLKSLKKRKSANMCNPPPFHSSLLFLMRKCVFRREMGISFKQRIERAKRELVNSNKREKFSERERATRGREKECVCVYGSSICKCMTATNHCSVVQLFDGLAFDVGQPFITSARVNLLPPPLNSQTCFYLVPSVGLSSHHPLWSIFLHNVHSYTVEHRVIS